MCSCINCGITTLFITPYVYKHYVRFINQITGCTKKYNERTAGSTKWREWFTVTYKIRNIVSIGNLLPASVRLYDSMQQSHVYLYLQSKFLIAKTPPFYTLFLDIPTHTLRGYILPLHQMHVPTTFRTDLACPAISDIHTRLYIENACKVFDCF